jgi:hypothetical protein
MEVILSASLSVCVLNRWTGFLKFTLREHRHNLKEGLLEKSKLPQYTYEEGHRVDWDEARILEIESNSRYRKYKELG